MMRASVFRRTVLSSIALSLALTAAPAMASSGEEAEIGTKLANLLRAGRSVVSANQPLINNAEIGDKNFTGQKLVEDAEVIYTTRTGAPLAADALSARDARLIAAQKQAMRRIVDDRQAEINRKGIGFKGFIPAVFARLTNEEFETLAGTEARIRVTAPAGLVRNRKARPDSWEKRVLETKLLSPDWPKGAAYTEVVDYEGRPAFRMLFPEYYRDSCLSCHGEPKGETDVTGYPKEGGKSGELGGAISIVIFR